MRRNLFFHLNILLACHFASVVFADDFSPKIIQSRLHFGYDQIRLLESERMGLFEATYSIDITQHFYTGVAVYSAVTGNRGGFFTGGFIGGARVGLFERTELDAGLFFGGGGGGAAPQGGGMTIRPYIKFGLEVSNVWWYLGISRVSFPNGQIDSSQITGGVEIPMQLLILPGTYSASDNVGIYGDDQILDSKLEIVPSQFTAEYFRYYHPNGIAGRGSAKLHTNFDLVGVHWARRLVSNWWIDFSTHGAMGGNDGYAQWYGGISYQLPITGKFRTTVGGLFGAGGGGDVNTGGGLLSQISVGADYRFWKNWSVGVNSGYAHAIDGAFSALSTNVHITREYNEFDFKSGDYDELSLPKTWVNRSIRIVNQRYVLFRQNNGRKNRELADIPVDMVGLKLDRDYGEISLTGQAFGAYSGGVGGYAVGLVGLDFWIYRNSFVRAGAEFLVGAAGGGGIDAGSGFIAQPMVNFAVAINPEFYFTADAGIAYAPNGRLNVVVADIGIGYRFSVPSGDQ